MVPYLIFAVIIAAVATAGVVYSHYQKRSVRKQFEAQFPSAPIVLDPVGDAPLMGEHYWLRLELFDLLQKEYVGLDGEEIKSMGKKGREGISETQHLMLLALSKKGGKHAIVGGELLRTIASNPVVAEKMA